MKKKNGFILIIALGGIIACLDPAPSQRANLNNKPETHEPDPLLGGEGQPCFTNGACEEGLVCENGLCVVASQPSDAGNNSSSQSVDSGTTNISNDDGGNAPISDAGTVSTTWVDAGNDLVDSGLDPFDAGPPPEPVIPWLISVHNNADQLIKIDTATGNWVVLCDMSISDNFHSTTFGFDGTLYGSNSPDKTLDIIDPCTCEVTSIGPTNQGSIPGITANGEKEETLFGLSTSSDTLVTLDIETGAGTLVGSLGDGLDFINSGTTWSSVINGLYSINSGDQTLYDLNIETGAATPITALDINVGAVGIEWHPTDQKLYFCTNPQSTSYLYEVNTVTGATTEIGTLPGRCTNLAAPWVPVACVDEVVVE